MILVFFNLQKNVLCGVYDLYALLYNKLIWNYFILETSFYVIQLPALNDRGASLTAKCTPLWEESSYIFTP